ncbi:AzlC family ABC transporter permease [Aureimonas sp. D3]|uniref:AzlC family ABC transporter permease n=1 Tax=Aureimonas sp. D3 TaxID=1638164 RepID=UPI000784E1AE|nr:AzlC family ABC transporter permease [Aureimonas sp. D3]
MSRSSEFRAGLAHSVPLLLALVPFGGVYGALATRMGLSLPETLGFSLSVYAGSSQFLALQMIGTGAPVWAILIGVFAINFRHVLYSASIGRHLGRFNGWEKAVAFFLMVDPSFAAAEARASDGVVRKTYYFTFALVLYVGWALATVLGALFGRLIENPERYALDFALPIYFLAQTMAFRHRRQFWPVAGASAFAAVIAYGTLGSPWHVTLGGLAGILVAVLRTPAGGKQAKGEGA